jgi:hypothetical protein
MSDMIRGLLSKEKVQKIVDEVYPKIVKHYGVSKFHECSPWVELHHNIYVRLTGEDDQEMSEDFPEELKMGDCDPDAEFDRQDNTIVLYHPRMNSRQTIIETLVHEYQHHLQSPSWFKRYYDMGYDYMTHPYEVEATAKEKEWVLFN